MHAATLYCSYGWHNYKSLSNDEHYYSNLYFGTGTTGRDGAPGEPGSSVIGKFLK